MTTLLVISLVVLGMLVYIDGMLIVEHQTRNNPGFTPSERERAIVLGPITLVGWFVIGPATKYIHQLQVKRAG